MTDREKRAKQLKTGKSYGLYPTEIQSIKERAREWDISASQYVEAMLAAAQDNTTVEKVLKTWKKEAERRGIQLNIHIEETTREAATT